MKPNFNGPNGVKEISELPNKPNRNKPNRNKPNRNKPNRNKPNRNKPNRNKPGIRNKIVAALIKAFLAIAGGSVIFGVGYALGSGNNPIENQVEDEMERIEEDSELMKKALTEMITEEIRSNYGIRIENLSFQKHLGAEEGFNIVADGQGGFIAKKMGFGPGESGLGYYTTVDTYLEVTATTTDEKRVGANVAFVKNKYEYVTIDPEIGVDFPRSEAGVAIGEVAKEYWDYFVLGDTSSSTEKKLKDFMENTGYKEGKEAIERITTREGLITSIAVPTPTPHIGTTQTTTLPQKERKGDDFDKQQTKE